MLDCWFDSNPALSLAKTTQGRTLRNGEGLEFSYMCARLWILLIHVLYTRLNIRLFFREAGDGKRCVRKVILPSISPSKETPTLTRYGHLGEMILKKLE